MKHRLKRKKNERSFALHPFGGKKNENGNLGQERTREGERKNGDGEAISSDTKKLTT